MIPEELFPPEDVEACEEQFAEEQVAEFDTHLYCMYDPVEICGETFYPQDILRMLSPEKYRSEYLTFIGQSPKPRTTKGVNHG